MDRSQQSRTKDLLKYHDHSSHLEEQNVSARTMVEKTKINKSMIATINNNRLVVET